MHVPPPASGWRPSPHTSRPQPRPQPQVQQKAVVCSVWLDPNKNPATGVIVGRVPEGDLVATCKHVVQQGVYCVRYGNGLEAQIHRGFHDQSGHDLALLLVDTLSVPLASVATICPRTGAQVWMAGWGNGRYAERAGQVMQYFTDGDFEVSTPGYDGDSGAPAFDNRGQVVGILWGTNGRTSTYVNCEVLYAFKERVIARLAEEREQPDIPVPDEDTELAVESHTPPCEELSVMVPIVRENTETIAALLALAEANATDIQSIKSRLDKIEAWPMPEKGDPGPPGPQGPPGPAGVFDPAALTDAQLADLAQRLPPIHVEVEMLEKPPENPQHNQDVRLGDTLPLRLYLVPPRKQ